MKTFRKLSFQYDLHIALRHHRGEQVKYYIHIFAKTTRASERRYDFVEFVSLWESN